jgi:hypothetical protein
MYYLHILVYLNICCRLTNKRKKWNIYILLKVR